MNIVFTLVHHFACVSTTLLILSGSLPFILFLLHSSQNCVVVDCAAFFLSCSTFSYMLSNHFLFHLKFREPWRTSRWLMCPTHLPAWPQEVNGSIMQNWTVLAVLASAQQISIRMFLSVISLLLAWNIFELTVIYAFFLNLSNNQIKPNPERDSELEWVITWVVLKMTALVSVWIINRVELLVVSIFCIFDWQNLWIIRLNNR